MPPKARFPVIDGFKKCLKCGRSLAIENFYRRQDGGIFNPKCKECCRANSARWRVENVERHRENCDRWSKKNPKRRDFIMWRAHIRRKYGISPDDYEKILTEQGGRCGICRCLPQVGKKFHVDHDHKSKKVRGLLCIHCNFAVSRLDISIDWAQSALDYLKKYDYGGME